MGRRWTHVGGAVAISAVVVFLVWVNRRELPAAGRALRDADRWWLCAAFGVLLIWWLDWALLHVASRRVTGVGGYRELLRRVPVTLVSIALNLAVKSGNVAGLAAFAADGRRQGAPGGRVAGAYLAAAQLAEVTFIVTLGAGMAVAWTDHHVTRPEVVALVIFVAGLLLRAGSLVAVVRSREAVRSLWTFPARVLDWVRDQPAREHDTTSADQFYDAVAAIRAHPRASIPAVCFSVAIDFLGAAILWASLAAVGGGNRPLLALMAYAVSTLFGIVGVLPGGIGFVEIGAAAVLVSFDTPIGVAAAAVVVFRVFVFWIPLAAGLLIAWRPSRQAAEPLVPPEVS